MINIRFSCVVDDSPLYRIQALNWIYTILARGLTCPEKIVIYLVDGNGSYFQHTLKRLGVTVRLVEQCGTGEATYRNKLLQLDSTQLNDIDCVVICDTDIVFAGDILPWVSITHVRARIANPPTPSLEVLNRMYATTGLTTKPRIVETSFDHGLTFETNCNTGIYFIPAQWLKALRDAWAKWTSFALGGGDFLGAMRENAVQIGFCFAMLELGLLFDPLPNTMNYSPYSPTERYSLLPEITPLVLHYHKHLDQSGFLLPTGLSSVDSAIAGVNRVIADHRHRHFDNKTFWDYRYAYHPTLGSGRGSRGDSLDYKRRIVQQAIECQNPPSILDIGCGDQFVTECIPDDRYTGIDLSPVVIEQARKKYPRRNYIIGDFMDQKLSRYALTLCFDVAIHLDNIDLYREFVNRIVLATSEHGIVAGYEAPPEMCSEITFFHEPLSKTLKRAGAIDLRNLGQYRDTDIWQFSTAPNRYNGSLANQSCKESRLV